MCNKSAGGRVVTRPYIQASQSLISNLFFYHMTKRFLPLLLMFVLLGAGCNAAQDTQDQNTYDLTAIEAEFGLDLPDDTKIDQLSELPGYYNIIAYTDTDWEELRDSFHTQLIAQGFEDKVSAKDAVIVDSEDDIIIASYLKQDPSVRGSSGIDMRAFTIGIEDGQTKYSLLRQ